MTDEQKKQREALDKKIEDLERKRLWSQDVFEDPPTIPLTPDKVDYLQKKFSSRVKSFFANFVAWNYIQHLINKKQLIIKNVEGIENYTSLKGQGIIVTCNHFSPFDNFVMHRVYMPRSSGHIIYKIIREGNYTNFPGFYGMLFRNCNTLPLSSNFSTMRNFMEAVKTLLNRKKTILIYPEQGLWPNYRKPRPMENGAFKFAVSSNCPVVPTFITMKDSNVTGPDGYPVPEYYVHILKPIYSDPNLSPKENMKAMNQKNYEEWKECYEKFYGIPLEYLPEAAEASESTQA